MPTEDSTITPYTTCFEMHCAFVLDTEHQLSFEHAKASARVVFAATIAEDDIKAAGLGGADVDLDENAAAAATERASLTRATSRYGNTHMGRRTGDGAVPCHQDIAGYDHFKATYHKSAPGDPGWSAVLKMRKWLPFAKCTDCSTYRTTSADTVDPVALAQLKEKQAKHLAHCKRERTSYMVRQQLAILYPESFLSLIFDGADCSKTEVPHMAYRSHTSAAAHKVLDTHTPHSTHTYTHTHTLFYILVHNTDIAHAFYSITLFCTPISI